MPSYFSKSYVRKADDKSYFATCERDDEGHCKAGGGSGDKDSADSGSSNKAASELSSITDAYYKAQSPAEKKAARKQIDTVTSKWLKEDAKKNPVKMPSGWTERHWMNPDDQKKVREAADSVLSTMGTSWEKSRGFCAAASTLLWERMGRPADVVPTSFSVGEEEHVALFNKKQGYVIDPTGDQFGMPVFSSNAKERGYKRPAKLKPNELIDAGLEAAVASARKK